jgi:hypothetical protein
MRINHLGEELADRYQPPPVTMPAINLPDLDSAAIEAETREAQARVRVIRAGRDAWEQINKAQSFSGWVAVGKALAVGRDFALRATGANRAEGRAAIVRSSRRGSSSTALPGCRRACAPSPSS